VWNIEIIYVSIGKIKGKIKLRTSQCYFSNTCAYSGFNHDFIKKMWFTIEFNLWVMCYFFLNKEITDKK